MQKFIIDCSAVTSEGEFWDKYLEVTCPDGSEYFGRNLDAFNDAITCGGPGWPGECEVHFTNTARVQRFRSGDFFKALERIASESTSARLILEDRFVASKKAWWKLW
jgi:RNAse (barnase) inhibitor barstar